jgi:hypothetical protein
MSLAKNKIHLLVLHEIAKNFKLKVPHETPQSFTTNSEKF